MTHVAISRERGTSPCSRAFSRRFAVGCSVRSKSLSSATAAPRYCPSFKRRTFEIITDNYWRQMRYIIARIRGKRPRISAQEKRVISVLIKINSIRRQNRGKRPFGRCQFLTDADPIDIKQSKTTNKMQVITLKNPDFPVNHQPDSDWQ